MFDWLRDRIKEPSTYAGGAMVLGTIAQQIEYGQADSSMIIATVLGGLAMMLRDPGSPRRITTKPPA